MKPIAELIVDRSDEGVFQIDRDVFRDQDVFEAEIANVFEKTWCFVGLESQIPNPNDFITTQIGRSPIIVSRDRDGRIGAFINSCRHKGALLCPQQAGNRRLHVCPYHSWSYDSGGRNVAIKGVDAAQYSDAFLAADHDLARVPHLASYRGFLFASLNPDSVSLKEHLGDAATFIDLVVDQSPDGMEIVPGNVRFTYQANWKLQLENCVDAYHFTSTHASFLRVLERRAQTVRQHASVQAIFEGEKFWERREGAGSFSFPNGHVLAWGAQPPQPTHPLFDRLDEIRARIGDAKARWMFNIRNLSVFPNMQLADNAAIQLRVIRPVRADLTEMVTYCIAPKGEAPEPRARRIRQYEEFFNPSGLATPDDTVIYENCQAGFASRQISDSQGCARGMMASAPGANGFAAELGVMPDASAFGPFEMCDETLYRGIYRHWRTMMLAGEGGRP